MPDAPFILRVVPSDTQKIQFIMVLRGATGIGLAGAKAILDQRLADGLPVEIPLATADAAQALGRQFLEFAAAKSALMIGPGGTAPIVVIPRPPPAPCPDCGKRLRDRNECRACKWLRFPPIPPSDRSRWSRYGLCPRCHFAYRFDGTTCSHCGYPNEPST